MSKTTNRFPAEVREHAVRLVLAHEGQHGSRFRAIISIPAKIGCTPQTLNDWVKKPDVNNGRRADIPTGTAESMNTIVQENRKLCQANDIHRKVSAFLRWQSSTTSRRDGGFTNAHLDAREVEPICNVLLGPPSTDDEHLAKRQDPTRLSDRTGRE